jgi:hypothetical protein
MMGIALHAQRTKGHPRQNYCSLSLVFRAHTFPLVGTD